MIICRYRLEADWLPKPVTWIRAASEEGSYRLPPLVAPAIRPTVHRAAVLNHRLSSGIPLPRVGLIEGFLIGSFPGHLPPDAPGQLPATLIFEDQYASEHPFAIELVNSEVDSAWVEKVVGDAARAQKAVPAPRSGEPEKNNIYDVLDRLILDAEEECREAHEALTPGLAVP